VEISSWYLLARKYIKSINYGGGATNRNRRRVDQYIDLTASLQQILDRLGAAASAADGGGSGH